jgi:hypothetical protein
MRHGAYSRQFASIQAAEGPLDLAGSHNLWQHPLRVVLRA